MERSSRYAVRLEGVTKRYGDFVAVSDLSLAVRTGTIFGLLGPNGAGKSTTIRMINDILAPDEGRITLFDATPPGREAAVRIGYLPEERGLYPKMTVGAVIEFFGELRGLHRREAARRADAWLDRLELGAWKGRKVQDLSKGMQQKVQFITAVLHEPDLLILDEPWSGLDPLNAEVLLEIVQQQKDAGRTIVFSTHQMDQAERLCDEVCIISRARKILDGRVADVRRDAGGGRTVALAFEPADDRDDGGAASPREAVLGDAALVAARREHGTHVEVDLAEGVSAQELLRRLVGAGVAVRRFEVLVPTLHQVFVTRVRAQGRGQERAQGQDTELAGNGPAPGRGVEGDGG